MDEKNIKKTNEDMECLIKRMELSQTHIEQYAYKTLNHHDIICRLYTENIEKIMGMLSFMEGISFQTTNLKDAVENIKKINEKESLCKELSDFFLILSEQQEVIQEICGNMQNIIEHQSMTCDIVHNLENSIAGQRSNLEELSKLYHKV